jgi:hypothetical protein
MLCAMGAHARRFVALLAAALGGAALAVSAASGSSPQTVTLGNASGEPNRNICSAMSDCTYLPYAGASDPELQVPFVGTVTSFSVNAGSSEGQVELRVLRPGESGHFTAVGTSPLETLSKLGINSFSVSLPVGQGDVLALDNESSAIVFEASTGTASTYYFEPAIAEESTKTPSAEAPDRLLLSAEVQASPTTTTTTAPSTSTATTPVPPPVAEPTPPVLSELAQTHAVWREGNRPATISSTRAPVGTTFSFILNEQASVRLLITRQLSGRKVAHRCVAQTKANAKHGSCTRTEPAGGLSLAGHGGANSVFFDGQLSPTRGLKPGRYVVAITAANAAGTSAIHRLSFLVVRR